EATPVAIIENGTRQNQRVLITTLAGLPETVEQQKPVSPSLLIVGDVVRYYRADRVAAHGCDLELSDIAAY
ncbi:uroporphyrinogen-III C-methyltransferase, partial [Pantoea dispersa]